ncbi:RNA-directed DNA polymerase, eukaryota [Tanacetum coccineum]
MGSYKTKEDDVARISTSVYITNFPEMLSAKELFHACNQYGHVVDSFIPTKKSRECKRDLGYVRHDILRLEGRIALGGRWKTYWIRANETPGWVPDFTDEVDDEDHDEINSMAEEDEVQKSGGMDENSDGKDVPETTFEDEELVKKFAVGDTSDKKGDKSEDPLNIYSLLNRLAQKAKKDWVKELCIKNKVNFLVIQETKMENMEDLCVRQCWGNLAFDHVHSDAVGNSGGILYVWDPNSFGKSNVTLSDYFVISRGHWRLTGQKMMIIAVYAPQDSKEKQTLWDYLQQEIGK